MKKIVKYYKFSLPEPKTLDLVIEKLGDVISAGPNTAEIFRIYQDSSLIHSRCRFCSEISVYILFEVSWEINQS